jgi:hypothetical protein
MRVVYRKEDGMKTETERMAGSIHHGEDRMNMNITYRLLDPLIIELAALCEVTHGRTLRVTREMTPRRAASSMMRTSPVVVIQPD